MTVSIDQTIDNYIQSFIYSFEAAYDSSHTKVGDIPIFYYGQEFSDSPYEVVPYQSVVFVWNKSPEEINDVIQSYKFQGDGSYAIQIFHEEMDPQKYKLRFQPLGYEYFLPNILEMAKLPTSFEAPDMVIQEVTQAAQADFINETFSTFKPFPRKLAGALNSHAFYAEIDQQAAGWGYLILRSPHCAYVAGMFTQPEFRRKGVATALLNKMHQFTLAQGIDSIILVPSFMAWNFYTKRGYQTVAHFSTFLPSENKEKESVNS